jgi:predicted ATPase
VFEAMRADQAARGKQSQERATRIAGASDGAVDPAGLATEHAGAAATEAGPRNNVPPRLDRFVGRQQEVALLRETLEGDARVVSIVGPAGAGKTRLSTEYVAGHAPRYPGGGWFVALDGTTDTEGLCAAVGAVFGQHGRMGEPVESVGRLLRERGAMLLVLDNVEQFLRPVADAVQRWAALAPETQFVVTSRHPLDMQGERVIRIDPLGMPTPDGLGDAAELFVERARQADARFTLRGEEVADLEAIVRELDGLPLAIELAAAKVRMLSLPALRERLRRRFALLTTRQRERGRRATLRGALDSSWELLEPWEQHALLQLSVFRAPFALEDAEAVVSLDAWPHALSVMDALANLVDHSLVQVVRAPFGDGPPLYQLLVSIREYADARWHALEQGDDADAALPCDRIATEARHGERFARWGRKPPHDGIWRFASEDTAGIRRAGEDLLIACERACDRADWGVAAATAFGVTRLCTATGAVARGVRTVRRVIDEATLSPHYRALLLTDMALLHLFAEHAGADAAFQAAIEAAKASGDAAIASRAMRGQATGALESGRLTEADRLLDAALAIHGDEVPENDRIHTNFTRATLRIQQVRYDEAEALLAEAEAYAERVDDRHFAGVVASWGHVLAMKQGRREDSRARLEAALVAALEQGHAVNHARYLRSLALLDRLDEDPKTAVERMEQAIAIQETISTLPLASYTLHAAMAALELGQVKRAQRYFERHPIPPLSSQNAAWIARSRAGEALVAAHAGDADAYDQRLALAREAQAATGIEAVGSQVAAYAGMGALLLGRVDEAQRYLRVARDVAERLGIHPSSVEGHELRWLERSLAARDAAARPVPV